MDLTTRRSLANDLSDGFAGLRIKRRCELMQIHRSGVYYKPQEPSEEARKQEELTKSRLDFWHTKFPALGSRKLRKLLNDHEGIAIGRKLVKRYMDQMGIYPVYPKPNLSKSNKEHPKLPYLLRGMNIFIPNQVWAIDITYIPMKQGHMYLTAIIDWHSRFIVGWELSDTLDSAPVLQAVKKAIQTYGTPGIINSDQGSQFTSHDYQNLLKTHKIKQSMDGKARWVDNVIIERWFRSLKVECIYINEFETPRALRLGIRDYICDYNVTRPHQTQGYATPKGIFDSAFAA